MLKQSGFINIESFFKFLNFTCLMAIK